MSNDHHANKDQISGYELSRDWFDWSFENPELITPTHTAVYFFTLEHWNRLGQKEKFGLPTAMCMDAIGVKNWRTFSNAFTDLVNWGFLKLITKSKNQYSATVVAVVKNTKANTKALTKATQKHVQKQSNCIVVIDKPNNLITLEYNKSEIKISQPKFNFKNSLIDLGVSEIVASDWLKVRAKKKASNTETAFNGIKREIEKSPISANESIQIAVEKSWQSFKSEWIQNLNNKNGQTFKTTAGGKLSGNYAAAEQLAREIEEKSRNFVSPLHQSG